MSKRSTFNHLTLLGHGLEGGWNIPLVENAAAISGAAFYLVDSKETLQGLYREKVLPYSWEIIRGAYDHIIACETTYGSKSIYTVPSPRGNIAVMVGNESNGLPREILTRADTIASIPMKSGSLSSLNVAAAAAVILYVLDKDLARKSIRTSAVRQRDADILLYNPPNPHDAGSLLRSCAALGWRKVFVADKNEVWFTPDRNVALQGRAAARREKNPIIVADYRQLNLKKYDLIILAGNDRSGKPLSKFKLPDTRSILLVLSGCPGDVLPEFECSERIFVDCRESSMPVNYRHWGSIILSMLSQMLA